METNIDTDVVSIMRFAVCYGKEIYYEHLAGGWCHIVLDDDNVEDDDILYCIQASIQDKNNSIQKIELICMGLYLMLTEEQRLECNRRIHGR